MGSATNLRVGNVQGRTAPAAGESPRRDGPEFLPMLAAADDVQQQGAPAASDGSAGTAAAEDPAMAALLAAMLPGLLPATARPGGNSPVDGEETVEADAAGTHSIEDLLTSGTAVPTQATQELEEALQASLAQSSDEMPATTEPAADLLPQIGRELAAALREAAPDLRGAPELRAPALGEPQPGNALASSIAQPGGTTSATPATGNTEAALRTPVGAPRWAEELGSRLVMMSTRGQHEGSLTLAPEHLGPLEVRISMQHNNATVWFGAQHADTRAALTEALPRLRELFAEAGLSLGQAGVSQEAPRRELPQIHAARPGSEEEGAGARNGIVPQTVRRSVSGLLDLYA